MPTLYPTTAAESITWPEPFESAYQAQQRRHGPAVLGARRPDITRPLRLLIASVVDLGDKRPHGMITALAEALATTRQTIYDIGWTWSMPWDLSPVPVPDGLPRPSDRNAVARAALTLLVVGAMQVRATKRCLSALLGHERSIGWLSGLVDEAGARAGTVLATADWSGTARLIVSRDELYIGELAWLLTVDTKSHAIVSGHVEPQVDAETWAVSLALDADKTGCRIDGLAEDAARCYPASVALAEVLLGVPFKVAVQKDNWHLLRQASQTARDADRIALRHLEVAERQASWVRPVLMKIRDFDGWEASHERARRSMERADAIRPAVGLLREALGCGRSTDGSNHRPGRRPVVLRGHRGAPARHRQATWPKPWPARSNDRRPTCSASMTTWTRHSGLGESRRWPISASPSWSTCSSEPLPERGAGSGSSPTVTTTAGPPLMLLPDRSRRCATTTRTPAAWPRPYTMCSTGPSAPAPPARTSTVFSVPTSGAGATSPTDAQPRTGSICWSSGTTCASSSGASGPARVRSSGPASPTVLGLGGQPTDDWLAALGYAAAA